MILETIRLSEKEKQQLITLKRRTGIKNWNVLCRWGFCLSIAEPSVPPEETVPSDSSVEMSWKVFGGPHSEIYSALLKQRVKVDGLDATPSILAHHFRLHLNRGISYLTRHKSVQEMLLSLDLSGN